MAVNATCEDAHFHVIVCVAKHLADETSRQAGLVVPTFGSQLKPKGGRYAC